MNLSTYLQMPPAPPAAQGTQTQAAQGAAAGAGQVAGASLGFDFAQVMAKQMVRFSPQQRQEFAASPAANSTLQTDTRARDTTNAHPERDMTRTDARRDTQSSDRTDDTRDTQEDDDAQTTSRRHTNVRRTNKAQPNDLTVTANDPLASVMTQIAAVVSPADQASAEQTQATALAASDANSLTTAGQAVAAGTPAATPAAPQDVLAQLAARLHTVELSQRVRIVTDPQQAPSPESLTAFAKSMGLDEQAIQSLMGQQPNATLATANTGLATVANALAQTSNGLHSSPMGMSAEGLQALTSTTLQNAQISATPTAPTVVTTAPQTAAEFNHGSLLPAMSPADMASIQQLQVTVLPAAVALPANAHVALNGTADHDLPNTLSLLGGPLLEQDIAELASGFGESGSDMGSDTASGDANQSGFGFAQTLANANTDKTQLNKTSNTQATQSMNDTYDQLSDKLSTEMAARIHKQLSDGQWKMKFGLRPENLGGVEIQLEMKDGKLDAVFRADNPLTRDLLQNSSQRLRDALENFGIQAGLVHVGQDGGASQQQRSSHANNPAQFGHNSNPQVSNDSDVAATEPVRNKANASLLDLYA